MNSETVYQVAKALQQEEQILLFDKLKKDLIQSKTVIKKRQQLKKEDATHYLLTRIFNKQEKTMK